jgi:hypothetical protein
MQALEAMQRLVNISQSYADSFEAGDESEEYTVTKEAIEKIEQMLGLALPLARFRCHVEVDAESRGRGRIKDEFTICSPNIHGIFGGLIGLSSVRTEVRVTLWEQSIEKAEMVSGYQGPSKATRYKRWLQEMSEEFSPPVVAKEEMN